MKKLLPILIVTLGLWMLFGCEKDESINSISLNKTNLSLEVGETHSLKVSVNPPNLEAPVYNWKTSDNETVSVNSKGEIKAVSIGEATITVYNADKSLQSSCKVTVKPTMATGISLDKEYLDLIIDEEYTLKYKFSPEETTNKEVSWSSGDTNIATVDSKGKIKATEVGETIITVFNHDKTVSASCKVNIMPISATSLTLSETSLTLDMHDMHTLIVHFIPDNTTDQSVVWSSSDSKIASVSENGEVTALREGVINITVQSEDGKFTAQCKVTVKAVITLTEELIELLPNGKQRIKVKDISGAPYYRATWKSSNPNIAIINVENNGESVIVEAVNIGSTKITATSADGSKTVTCDIKVKKITEFLTLELGFKGYVGGYYLSPFDFSITNNSSDSIKLLSCTVHDNDKPVYYMPLSTLLYPGYQLNLNEQLRAIFPPLRIVWEFEWNNNVYVSERKWM